MLKNLNNYSLLSDEELVQELISGETKEGLYVYFFKKKCKKTLDYLAGSICHDNPDSLLGEFYEFLSSDDWAVVRKWKKRNGATLTSYLSGCATNYFIGKQNKEKKRQETEIALSTFDYLDYAEEDNISFDEQDKQMLWQAYEMLSERDRAILEQLVIEGKSALEAAPVVWKHINSQQEYDALPAKRVQCTLSMAKNRAQTALLNNMLNLMGRP